MLDFKATLKARSFLLVVAFILSFFSSSVSFSWEGSDQCPDREIQKVICVKDYEKHVLPDSASTYFDLIKEVFPDAQFPNPQQPPIAQRSRKLSNIGFDFDWWRENQVQGVVSYQNPTPIVMEVIFLKVKGRPHLMALITPPWGNYQDFAILAVFQLMPAPKLLDAAYIKSDKHAHLDYHKRYPKSPLQRVGKNSEAVWITNAHFNAGEAFYGFDLIGVNQNKLKVLKNGLGEHIVKE